jgi:hypothetical protein
MQKYTRKTIFGPNLDWRGPMKCPRSKANLPKRVVVATGHQAFAVPHAEVIIAREHVRRNIGAGMSLFVG